MKREISGYMPRFDAKAEMMVLGAMNEKLGRIDEKNMGLRYIMWVDVVKWLPNNPKSEEKGGLI